MPIIKCISFVCPSPFIFSLSPFESWKSDQVHIPIQSFFRKGLTTNMHTYISKITIKNFYITMDNLERDEFIIIWVDACYKKETCVSKVKRV